MQCSSHALLVHTLRLCPFVPSIKNVQDCFVKTSPSPKAQLKHNLSWKPLPCSGAELSTPQPPDHHPLHLALRRISPVSLSPMWSMWPQGPHTTWSRAWTKTKPLRMGPKEMSGYRTQWLCFPSIHIPNASSQAAALALDTPWGKALQRRKGQNKHVNGKREGENRPTVKTHSREQGTQERGNPPAPHCGDWGSRKILRFHTRMFKSPRGHFKIKIKQKGQVTEMWRFHWGKTLRDRGQRLWGQHQDVTMCVCSSFSAVGHTFCPGIVYNPALPQPKVKEPLPWRKRMGYGAEEGCWPRGQAGGHFLLFLLR